MQQSHWLSGLKVSSPCYQLFARATKKVVDICTKKTTLRPAIQNKQSMNEKFFARFSLLPFSV
jgi:hypothetical protein